MGENKINNSVLSLFDRLSDVKLFINVLVIIIAADVGLQVASDKNLWDVFSQETISMKQYSYIGMGILVFIPFNIFCIEVLQALLEWIYSPIKDKLMPENTNTLFLLKQEIEKNKTYFSVKEFLTYSIKYNNGTLKYLYEKAMVEIENNNKMKKIILSFWVFFIVDIYYENGVARKILFAGNYILIGILIGFFIGCCIYFLQPNKTENSVTNFSKNFKDSLSLSETEKYFPQ